METLELKFENSTEKEAAATFLVENYTSTSDSAVNHVERVGDTLMFTEQPLVDGTPSIEAQPTQPAPTESTVGATPDTTPEADTTSPDTTGGVKPVPEPVVDPVVVAENITQVTPVTVEHVETAIAVAVPEGTPPEALPDASVVTEAINQSPDGTVVTPEIVVDALPVTEPFTGTNTGAVEEEPQNVSDPFQLDPSTSPLPEDEDAEVKELEEIDAEMDASNKRVEELIGKHKRA